MSNRRKRIELPALSHIADVDDDGVEIVAFEIREAVEAPDWLTPGEWVTVVVKPLVPEALAKIA